MIHAKTDAHNRMESSRVSRCQHFSQRKIFNATYYIEYILELILALRPKSERHCFVIHGDNVRPHTAEGLKYFMVQILSELPQILHTLQIWHHQTYTYLNI
jgi:hypothetical protein